MQESCILCWDACFYLLCSPDLPLLLLNDCSAADTAQLVPASPLRPSRINLGVNAKASKHSDRSADALAYTVLCVRVR